MRKIDRLQFLQLAGGILGASVVTAAAGCGGDDSTGTGPTGTGTGSTGTGAGTACDLNPPQVTIAANHGHVMVVTKAEATAGDGKTYNIMGTATHDHTVMVTSDSFKTMESGSTVTLNSSDTAGHSHSITVICA
jgi:hypothetical protein